MGLVQTKWIALGIVQESQINCRKAKEKVKRLVDESVGLIRKRKNDTTEKKHILTNLLQELTATWIV